MAGKLTYKNLQHITHTQNPFKGTMRFPMYVSRTQSHCYFTMVEANNDIEYHVSYGNTHDRVDITEHTYNLYKNVRGRSVHEGTDDNDRKVFFEHIRKPRVMAIVRSDNTIEHTRDSYWQGDRMKMSEWMSNGRGWNTPFYYFDSYRFGGNALVNYKSDGSKITLPIFQGLRIHADTLEPHESQNIQVFRRIIDRKKSKSLMEKYRTKLDVANSMLKCMDTDTMMVSVKDLYDEYAKADESGNYRYFPSSDAIRIGDDLLDQGSEFEASILYAIGLELQGFSAYAISNYGTNNRYRSVCEPSKLVPNIKARLSKAVYKKHSPFYEEEVPFLKTQGSEWGLRIVVNGVEVR